MKKERSAKRDFENIDIRRYYRGKPISAATAIIRSVNITIGVIMVATLISFGFRALGIYESNIIMTYILAVLIIAYLTDGYIYGVIASFLGVLVFNYFFTEPYFTLLAYNPAYPVTFLIMLFVALITSTLTVRVKRETRRAELRENRIKVLYQIERNMLGTNNLQQVAQVVARDIAQLFDCSALICIVDIYGNLSIKHAEGAQLFDSDEEIAARTEAFKSGIPCGAGTQLFRSSRAYFLPVNGQSGVLGVIGIAFQDSYILSDNQMLLLDTIGTQIALVLERERLYIRQQQAQVEIEHERLRGNLLRSVSHDLRTPLTGILGSASTIIDNYDILPDKTKKEFLQGICEDADWLNMLVENILSMTRFDEGRVKLNIEMEAVEEIVAEAVSRVKKRSGLHQVSISIPGDLIMIPVDGMLIEQALVNLIDNAINHTPEGSEINLTVALEEGGISFEVSDDGPGIPEGDLPYIFERFYTSGNVESGKRLNFGLGLAICKSITEAHGGTITAANKPTGGSVFKIILPVKEAK